MSRQSLASLLRLRRTPERKRLPRHRIALEQLEDRCVPTLTVVAPSIANVFEGQPNIALPVTTFTDSANLLASQFKVTVDYGDGSAASTSANDAHLVVSGSAGSYSISDNHTFAEESGSTVPPFVFNVTVTVTENIMNGLTTTQTGEAQVLDAPLAPGNPVPVGPGQLFTGTSQATATASLASFEAAIGGSKNTTAAPQNGGFRTITWDGVKVDGSDAVSGPNSTTVITPGHTVGIPLSRFEGSGVYFGAVYAVSNDGFVDVNQNVAGLLPAFSTPSTFAMFNDNGIDFKFVAAASPNTTPVSAVSRGFGAIFLNVEQPNTTTIQYFHGSTLLDTLNVPVEGTPGAPVFAGELFPNAIVTNVLLTLGSGVIFKFDGTTVSSGGVNSPTNNLVAVDDWAFAEPVPSANGFPIVSGAQGTMNAVVSVNAQAGTPFTGVVATFSDSDPAGNAKDYTATINWGDGHSSVGSFTKNAAGGFDVTGTNTYANGGTFPINVDVFDFGGGPGIGGSSPAQSINNTALVAALPVTPVQLLPTSTALIANPASLALGQATTVTATVVPTGNGTATGFITFLESGTVLATVPLNARDEASFTLGALLPAVHSIIAVYSGDTVFQNSVSSAVPVTVSADATKLFKATHKGHLLTQHVTLRNISNTIVPAHALLLVENLTKGVTLLHASGKTKHQTPLGTPFITLSLSGASIIPPGGTISFDLVFDLGTAKKASFSLHILGGISQA